MQSLLDSTENIQMVQEGVTAANADWGVGMERDGASMFHSPLYLFISEIELEIKNKPLYLPQAPMMTVAKEQYVISSCK